MTEQEWLTTDAIFEMVVFAFPSETPQATEDSIRFERECHLYADQNSFGVSKEDTFRTVGFSFMSWFPPLAEKYLANVNGNKDMNFCMNRFFHIIQTHIRVVNRAEIPWSEVIELAAHCRWQADLLREVLGNPFRKRDIDPTWRTQNVLDLARTIREEKAFERMPILGDALMDAGCEDATLLEHCQQKLPHVQECWLLTKLLKENPNP